MVIVIWSNRPTYTFKDFVFLYVVSWRRTQLELFCDKYHASVRVLGMQVLPLCAAIDESPWFLWISLECWSYFGRCRSCYSAEEEVFEWNLGCFLDQTHIWVARFNTSLWTLVILPFYNYEHNLVLLN
ncbi:uncharacterized protein LOC120085902 isoform X2 [Benincasa hispida]|uniref:uncharacterized protein LOC120085902 isoform X2 n=1 Tax=Benincasa hispida TaxID=102211 RepID=UPI0019015869|nr:uncharacterized protein LOC120085902 isoform X2 [Benincasa hispida]